jgi:hypothetical protein
MPQAYCILAHKDPYQVRRLVDHFSNGDCIYINVFNHESTKVQAIWTEQFEDLLGERFVLNFSIGRNWGGFGLVQAVLDGMRRFQEQNYTHFINLSGQCYPIKPVNSIREYFHRASCSFIEGKEVPWDDANASDNGYLDRFNYRWIRVPIPMIDGRNRFIKLPRLDKTIPGGLKPYKGSQWFCLRKEAVEYILRTIRDEPRLVRFFKMVGIPDENFFQTIVFNSPETVVRDNLRYIDWKKKGVPLPAVLTMEDFDQLKSTPKLFARKFDQNRDSSLLDRVDRELLN